MLINLKRDLDRVDPHRARSKKRVCPRGFKDESCLGFTPTMISKDQSGFKFIVLVGSDQIFTPRTACKTKRKTTSAGSCRHGCMLVPLFYVELGFFSFLPPFSLSLQAKAKTSRDQLRSINQQTPNRRVSAGQRCFICNIIL